jgi:hypothetical protein
MLIAPDNSKSDWKTSDAIYAYCTKCDTMFDYHYKNNSKGVSGHYYKCREYDSKKQAAVETAAIEAAPPPPPATIRTKLLIGNLATAAEKDVICCSNKDCKEWPYTKVNSPDRAQCVLCNGWMHSERKILDKSICLQCKFNVARSLQQPKQENPPKSSACHA